VYPGRIIGLDNLSLFGYGVRMTPALLVAANTFIAVFNLVCGLGLLWIVRAPTP
jgi:hypothetical protein